MLHACGARLYGKFRYCRPGLKCVLLQLEPRKRDSYST
jgi:hypothetical protein